MDKKQIIENKFLDFVEKYNKIPSLNQIYDKNVTESSIKYNYTNKAGLISHMKKKYPELFEKVFDVSIFDSTKFKEYLKEVKEYKKFFITTAVGGCSVFKEFYESIQIYCKHNNAKLLILPANNNIKDLDDCLYNEILIYNDCSLNKNFFISTIKLSPKQIDPVTGLARIGQRNGSFVFASPKQRLFYVPTSKNKLPHALMTPGAITLPKYTGVKYEQFRTDYIATHDHVMGGVIVEIEDNKKFHFRQVQSDKHGCFYDLDKKYTPTKVEKSTVKCMVWGDFHSYQKCDIAYNKNVEIAKQLKPEKIILHDVFDGFSISHHLDNKLLFKSNLYNKHNLTLKKEIDILRQDLINISKLCKEVIIVKSNHDEFLNRYLEDGRFMTDYVNCKYAVTLAKEMLDDKDPLKEAIGDLKNVKWLKRDEDYYVSKIQLGSHGDKGANGAKGSIRSIENAHGSAIVGHSHTPQILRGIFYIGTTSMLKQDYNLGYSSWVHSSATVYDNGMRQLINIIEGSWRNDS